MAEGEKVGSVYVSVGIEAEETLRTLQQIEDSLSRIESKRVTIGGEGSQRPPTQPNPTNPTIAQDTRQAPPPAGSSQRVVTPVDLQVNANKIADQIQAVLSGRVFDIRVRIANLQDIEAQLGEMSVSVRAESARATGQSSGGGGTAAVDTTTITAGLNEKMAKALKGMDTDLLTRSLNEILEATGKSVTVSTRPGQDPTIEQQRTFIAKALQELGVAGQSASTAFGRIQGELKKTGQYSDVAIRNLMQGIGYTPAGTYRDDGTKTTKNAYGGILRVAQHVTPETVQTTTPSATSAVRGKPVATTTTTPVQRRPTPPDLQRVQTLEEQERLRAQAMMRIAREAPAAERIPLSGGPARGVLPPPMKIGSPRDSRGAREVPGYVIGEGYGALKLGATWREGGEEYVDDQGVKRRRPGYWSMPADYIKRINDARARGEVVRGGGLVPARHGLYQDPDTGELVLSPYGGSENAAGRTDTQVVDPAPAFQGQQDRATQIAMHNISIGGRPLGNQLAAAILQGQADYPGVVLKNGQATDIGVQVPLISESTANLPGFAGKEMLGRALFARRGWMNVQGFDSPQEVQRLSFRQWVERQVIAELGADAMDDDDIATQVAELTAPNGYLSRVMQARRRAIAINPRSIMAPGGPGTPGPHQSAAASAGSEGAGISPNALAREAAEKARYGIITSESGFVEIPDPSLRAAMSALYPLAEVRSHPDLFPGRPTKAVYEKVHQGPGDEGTWTLAGYRPTGERNEAQVRELYREHGRDSRMRALYSAYPQAFSLDEKGRPVPDPRFITEEGMLTPDAVTELPLTQLRRVAAADIESREKLEMTPEENELFKLAQETFERLRSGDVGSGKAAQSVGRFRAGQSLSEGPINSRGQTAFYNPVVGAFDYALQEALNRPGGIFDRMDVDDRPQNLGGIIRWAKSISPLGREIIGPAISGYLAELQNREYFTDQVNQSIGARETSATREQLGELDPKKAAAGSSRRRGRTINPKTGLPYRDNTGDYGRVPELPLNPFYGPMGDAIREVSSFDALAQSKGTPKEGQQDVGLRAEAQEVAAAVKAERTREYRDYRRTLLGRQRAQARARALQARGIDPSLSDEKARDALRSRDEFWVGTGKYHTKTAWTPRRGMSPKRTTYREEIKEFDEEAFEGEWGQILTESRDTSDISAFGTGAVRTAQLRKLARLRRAQQDVSDDPRVAEADARLARQERRIGVMRDIRTHAYGMADKLMAEDRYGGGGVPTPAQIKAAVMLDEDIPERLKPAVASVMTKQMEGGGSLRQRFGERVGPGPLDRRRAQVPVRDMGATLDPRMGSLVYERTTKGRDLPTPDEVVAKAGERAGMTMPAQTEESKRAVAAESAAAKLEADAKAAAQRASDDAALRGESVEEQQAAGRAAREQVMARAREEAPSLGGGSGAGGAIPVFVTNWPSGGLGGGGRRGGGGGGDRPPTEEGATPEEEPMDEHSRKAALLRRLHGGLGQLGDQRLERARRQQSQSMGNRAPQSPGGFALQTAGEESDLKTARAENRMWEKNRQNEEREASRAATAANKERRDAANALARERAYGSDLVMGQMERLYHGEVDEDTAENITGLHGPVPWTDPTYSAAKQYVAPDIKARRDAEREADRERARVEKEAQAKAKAAGGPTEAERETARRVAEANEETARARTRPRGPTSRAEFERRLIAQGIPAPPEGPPYGFPGRELTPEAYAATEAGGAMAEVRGALRAARGRMPQRALGTTMIQLSQNVIGNAEEVNERIAGIEQDYALLGKMGRDRAKLAGEVREGRRIESVMQQSLGVTQQEMRGAARARTAARMQGDKAAEAEATASYFKHKETLDNDRLALEKHQKKLRENQNSYDELGKQMDGFSKSVVAAAKGAVGAKDIFRNLAAGFVGGIAGGLTTMGVSTIVQAVTQAVPLMMPELDKALGGGISAQRVQRSQAQTYLEGGLRDSAVLRQLASIGFTADELSGIRDASLLQAQAIAGNQLYNERIQANANASAIMRQQQQMGLPYNVAPANFAQQGGISISKQDIATILPPLGLALEMLGIDRMEAFGQDSGAKLVAQEISRIVPEQIPFDPLIAASRGPIAAIGDWFGGGHPAITNANAGIVSMNRRLEGTNTSIAVGELDQPVRELLESVQGTGDIVRELEAKGLTIQGLENIEQVYALVDQLSKPERDFRAYSDIFFDSTSFNNQMWGMGQRFELQNEQLRLQQGMAAAGQRPIQFGVGIAYRAGGPGQSAALNAEATALDDQILAGSQKALDDLVNIYGVSQDLVDEFAELGLKTRDWATEIGEIQSAQGLRNFNIQLIKANQSMADLRGLMGREGGSEIGQLQRANVLLQRRAQLLQFEMQQRKINFSVAMAGFQSIGLTGEERAANIRIAKKEASFQQEQLDINRQIFGNNVQLFDAQNIRNFRNLARDINNLIQTFDENARIQELNQIMGKATRRQDQVAQKVAQILGQEMEVINLQNQIIEQMATDTNKKLTLTNKMEAISARLRSSVNKIADAIERADKLLKEQGDTYDDYITRRERGDTSEGDRAGNITGGKEPVVVNINVAGHVVDAKQLARIVERELGEQGALQGLNN